MGYSRSGRPAVGRKYEVRLDDLMGAAVAHYAETRWPGNKHAAGIARRELITQAIYTYQRENNIMSTVDIVVLDATTGAPGMEWGLALDHAPGIATAEVEQFLVEHDAWDNAGTDTYALVVPDELWSADLNGLPYIEVRVPQVQAQALAEAIGDHGHVDEYVEPESDYDFGDASSR